MKITQISLCALLLLALGACKKQLDIKPNSALQVPVNAEDFQALMDNTNVFTGFWPYAGTAGADDGFVSDATWSVAAVTPRNAYIWAADVFNDLARNDWSLPYTAIFYANVVLDGTSRYVSATGEWQGIKGQAHFFRGYAYGQLAQQFCKLYTEHGVDNDPGLVLQDSPDPNAPSVRSSVTQTYRQIISDLSAAARLLPADVLTKTRPGKAAAYAALARTYLIMRQYEQAGRYADSSLRLHPTLLDYNQISTGTGPSFKRFNDEVLLHTLLIPTPLLLPVKYLVDTALYDSYEPGDLRKVLFFKPVAGTPYFNFNGSYDGTANLFNGPATDEMYLIRAESSARSGNLAASLDDLNFLRKNRYLVSAYTPLVSGNPAEVLAWVLLERRKELVLRGLRWADLRRLNTEPAFAKTVVKIINGQRYELPPGDPRYILHIPQSVINDTGIAQN